MSLAAWKGFMQLFTEPFYWEKTVHGLDAGHASRRPPAPRPRGALRSRLQPPLADGRRRTAARPGHRAADAPAARWTIARIAPRSPSPAPAWALLMFAVFAAVLLPGRLQDDDRRPRRRLRRAQPPDRAYLVWWNDPPKLAAIGFLFPPLTTLVFLPLAAIKPVATSLVALPLLTSIFAAAGMVLLDRTLARCEMPLPSSRVPLILAFGLNPMWVFYAGNGHERGGLPGDAGVRLYGFISWYETTEPRFLIAAGFGFALLVVTRYAFIVWALLVALLIGVALVRRRASRVEVEGSVIAFCRAGRLRPGAVDPVQRADRRRAVRLAVGPDLRPRRSTPPASTSAAQLGFDEVSRRLLELNVAVFPLAFAAVPALVIAFLGQRNDMALWLASFIVLGIVIMGAHALISQNEGLLTLRDSMPMALTSLVGAAWVYRSYAGFRIGGLGRDAGAADRQPLHRLEGRCRTTPSSRWSRRSPARSPPATSQEGTSSRGGFNVGIDPEAQMAAVHQGPHPHEQRDPDRQRADVRGDPAQRPARRCSATASTRATRRGTSVLNDPYGKVRYLLAAYNPRSGDLITRHYPGLNAGSVPGMTVVFRTERYILVRVATTNPNAPVRRTTTNNRNRTGTGSQTFAPAGSTLPRPLVA